MSGELITEIIILILTFIVGGGITTGVKSWNEAKATKSEAERAGLKTPVEIESIRVASLDLVLKNMQEENQMVRSDRDYWKSMYHQIKEEVDTLIVEMDSYRSRVIELQKALQTAESHAPSAGAEDHD